ncbi:hypothetical protein NC652_040826 [Populus alba x Populus x berolinensis]|uniref:Uncharacterized protein n=1 Tax=Populus alba x Populus x berolinensis TaxID=444605 RepID=A0AAD6PPE3_9ROSI|nr:hypothetical protein NC652_040826 [Populus alba x Populus x berolinensis]KAJ6951713.1 hypothetical protein NC653_040999 [Populus alba x Populus x berolinensis]
MIEERSVVEDSLRTKFWSAIHSKNPTKLLVRSEQNSNKTAEENGSEDDQIKKATNKQLLRKKKMERRGH